jgi:DTW domain-containing protein YfiP
VCPRCWSYRPICICSAYNANENSTAPISERCNIGATVVVWTHHKEWGSPSNTGSVLNVALNVKNNETSDSASLFDPRRNSCVMLMKGLPEHDLILQNLLQQEDVLPVVLWTKEGGEKVDQAEKQANLQRPSYVSLHDLTARISNRSSGKVVLIAIEGTWTTARKMASKLPPSVPRLHLSAHEIFWLNLNKHDGADVRPASQASSLPSKSRLHSLRKQKSNSTKVCTAEAVVSALVGMTAVTVPEANEILHLVETKVRRTIDYQGKTKLKLGISATSDNARVAT